MNKLKMHFPNLAQENIARIRELFPGCMTDAVKINVEQIFKQLSLGTEDKAI